MNEQAKSHKSLGYDETQCRRILKEYWGYDNFRGIQAELIKSIANGKDTLGLMPTGGGKSITFQVPALAMEGVCIVITPLIALMKDQVANLRKRNILAAAIHSGMTRIDIVKTLENCILGRTKILYVSPERLSSELFKIKLKHINVSFITVDEAHCISQWGYDFRPSYMHIADIRPLKPNAPVLALTATATPKVVGDIQDKLKFEHENVFKMSFERKNLAYVVRKTTDKYNEMSHILESVGGSAIVYVRSRRRASEISKMLNAANIDSTYYHAGLEHSTKDERQKAWHDGATRVMVSTNAFGMGIDKPDVRMVIHIDCPDSLEAYFQEAGRAGRDGKKAYAVLLYNDSDERKLKKRIGEEFPEKDYIKRVYEHLGSFYQIGVGSGLGHTFVFDIDKFCIAFRMFPRQVDSSLRILEKAGYINYDVEPDSNARVMFLLKRDQLYRLEGLPPLEDAVITALLRNYCGLFTDYSYIDENMISRQAGLTIQQTYLLLKDLTRRRILHFIPKRKTPLITYCQNREETLRLNIPKNAYEDRKEQYEKRISSVISYAKNDDICRSRQLLRYFGETKSEDCGQCDVCISHRPQSHEDKLVEKAKIEIMALFSDKKMHNAYELAHLPVSSPILDKALLFLVREEIICMDNGAFRLNDESH